MSWWLQQNHGYSTSMVLIQIMDQEPVSYVTSQGNILPRSYRLIFTCTNNTTEYEALVIGIKLVVEWKIVELQVFGDSQLVINQFNYEYQTKDDKMMPYKRMVDDFMKYFVNITFEQIQRLKKKVADTMATIASLLEIPERHNHYEFLVEQLFSLAYDNLDSQVICHLVGSESLRYGKIYTYLKDNTFYPIYLETKNETSSVKQPITP